MPSRWVISIPRPCVSGTRYACPGAARASAHTSTDTAPADKRARASSRAVLPVVRTSSTNAVCRCTCYPECRAYISGPVASRETRLWPGITRTPAHTGAERDPKLACQWPSQLEGLVVPASDEPPPVQRDWDQALGRRNSIPEPIGHDTPQVVQVIQPVREFRCLDQGIQRVGVKEWDTGTPERRWTGDARPAELPAEERRRATIARRALLREEVETGPAQVHGTGRRTQTQDARAPHEASLRCVWSFILARRG
jgi:hypothetical protein